MSTLTETLDLTAVSLAKEIITRKNMQTALDYLLERLLAEPNRPSEVDAKTKEVKTDPSGNLTSSHDVDPGRPEKTLGQKLASREEEQSGARPASPGDEGDVSRDSSEETAPKTW
jgi:hypothetical protein